MRSSTSSRLPLPSGVRQPRRGGSGGWGPFGSSGGLGLRRGPQPEAPRLALPQAGGNPEVQRCPHGHKGSTKWRKGRPPSPATLAGRIRLPTGRHRGLYTCSCGWKAQADVNGALNIYERAFQVSPVKGSSGLVARPVVRSFLLGWRGVHEPKRECSLLRAS
jgi:hypothetical protein